jgi:hypothetical protein
VSRLYVFGSTPSVFSPLFAYQVKSGGDVLKKQNVGKVLHLADIFLAD